MNTIIHTTVQLRWNQLMLKVINILTQQSLTLTIKILNSRVGDHVRISKYKNIFAKEYTPNSSEKVFVIKKVENAAPWIYVINDLSGEEITSTFYEKELQKTNQHEFRIEKVLNIKGDKLYVKWKGYNNSFNSWIDEKDLV